MTITTVHSTTRSSRGGFTLVEVLIGASISVIILAGVLSSAFLISRSTLATSDYSTMDREARAGLELFAREVRMASGVSNFSTQSVTLTGPTLSGTYTVNYTYVPADKKFYRAYGTANQRAIIDGVTTFELKRFTVLQDEAKNDLETKQLQLQLRAERSGGLRAFASNNVISARYILRNKVVGN